MTRIRKEEEGPKTLIKMLFNIFCRPFAALTEDSCFRNCPIASSIKSVRRRHVYVNYVHRQHGGPLFYAPLCSIWHALETIKDNQGLVPIAATLSRCRRVMRPTVRFYAFTAYAEMETVCFYLVCPSSCSTASLFLLLCKNTKQILKKSAGDYY